MERKWQLESREICQHPKIFGHPIWGNIFDGYTSLNVALQSRQHLKSMRGCRLWGWGRSFYCPTGCLTFSCQTSSRGSSSSRYGGTFLSTRFPSTSTCNRGYQQRGCRSSRWFRYWRGQSCSVCKSITSSPQLTVEVLQVFLNSTCFWRHSENFICW